jgi:hypothetical protein
MLVEHRTEMALYEFPELYREARDVEALRFVRKADSGPLPRTQNLFLH